MTIEEMTPRLEEALRDRFPDAALSAIPKEMSAKNMEGICIRFPGIPAAPVVYPEEALRAQAAGISPEAYIDRLAKGLREAAAQEAERLEPNLTNPDNLRVSVASKGMDVTGIPHMHIPGTDINLYARCVVGREEDSEMSYRVTNQHLWTFHMTANEVMERALSNSRHTEEYRVQPLAVKMAEMMGLDDAYMDEASQNENQVSDIWVISNRSGRDGAAAIAMPNILKEVREKLGENYYIIPSSRHELLALGESFGSTEQEKQELVGIIRQVNEETVAAKDQLSDELYFYDGQRLSMALQSSEEIQESLMDTMDDMAESLATLDPFEESKGMSR